MASALSEILELHKGRGVQSHGVVWRIEGTSSRVEQCKTELLETVCRDAQPFVHYEEPSLGVTGLDDSVEVAPAFGNCPWVPPPRSWGASLGLALTAAMSLIITTMLFYCLLARKTEIYTHVLNRGGKGVRSPADGLAVTNRWQCINHTLTSVWPSGFAFKKLTGTRNRWRSRTSGEV